MIKVQTLSLPRSGHSLLYTCLNKIFLAINEPNYSNSYCEFYNCCRSIPCKKGYLIAKNHDKKNDVPFFNNYKYIIQYKKDASIQMQAIYHFHQNNRKYNPSALRDSVFKNKSFSYFLESARGIKHYNQFIEKNINNHPYPENCYFLEFYEFLANPYKHLTSILSKVFELTVDDNIVDDIVTQTNFKLNNQYKRINNIVGANIKLPNSSLNQIML